MGVKNCKWCGLEIVDPKDHTEIRSSSQVNHFHNKCTLQYDPEYRLPSLIKSINSTLEAFKCSYKIVNNTITITPIE